MQANYMEICSNTRLNFAQLIKISGSRLKITMPGGAAVAAFAALLGPRGCNLVQCKSDYLETLSVLR